MSISEFHPLKIELNKRELSLYDKIRSFNRRIDGHNMRYEDEFKANGEKTRELVIKKQN